MPTPISVDQIKEEYVIEREIKVEGVKSKPTTRITFNTAKGHIKITTVTTTNQLSFDEEQMGAVLQLVGMMHKAGYLKALDLLREYLDQRGTKVDDSQLSLLEALNNANKPAEEETDPPADEEPPKRRSRKRKTNPAAGEPATDGDGSTVKVKAN